MSMGSPNNIWFLYTNLIEYSDGYVNVVQQQPKEYEVVIWQQTRAIAQRQS